MMSCMCSFYILLAAALFIPATPPQAAPPSADADALYADRAVLESALAAERMWAARVAQAPGDVDASWKLARARYWLGGHAADDRRKAFLEAGIDAARAAIAGAPERPEGHFWLAANMGALAESFGLRQGLRYRGDIKDALERVLAIDPAFQQGSADRALGRWYYKVPGLFGGSKSKSETHLRRSLAYDPQSTATLFFLAETLVALDRDAEARQALQAVIEAPLDPAWAPEDREFKARARELLDRQR